MRRHVSGSPPRCRVLLLVALAALLAHGCALETEAAHGSNEHAWSTDALPVPSEADGADLHAASCEGIRPTSMGSRVWTVPSQPMATVRLERMWSRESSSAFFLATSRPALFILHVSLLI